MALRLEDKKMIVGGLAEVASQAIAAGVADYRGLTVAQMTALRDKARQAGVYVKVVRNTLAIRAVAETSFACLTSVLTGPVILAFAHEEPGAVARLLKEFGKECEKLTVRGLSLSGKLLSAKDLDFVAKLPTREQALANFMATVREPVAQLVRTVAEPYAKLVRTVAAIRDQKSATNH